MRTAERTPAELPESLPRGEHRAKTLAHCEHAQSARKRRSMLLTAISIDPSA